MAPGRLGWADQMVWWHAYPLGVVGAERTLEDVEDVAHRLPRLQAWLDHVISLGANGLLLGPVFVSASHGYDTIDYFRIDPRLGDDADFDALIAAAHDRGLRVLLDGVVQPGVQAGQRVRAGGLARRPGADEAQGVNLPPQRVPDPVGCHGQSLACRAALSSMPVPLRGRASRAPVTELRQNSSPLTPDSSRALTTRPSGSVSFDPEVM